jgi:hypothetical protein
MKVKQKAVNSENEIKVDTSATKSIDNLICASRDCKTNASVRLYFSLGFSALFCNKCAVGLIQDGLANELPQERYEELFTEN